MRTLHNLSLIIITWMVIIEPNRAFHNYFNPSRFLSFFSNSRTTLDTTPLVHISHINKNVQSTYHYKKSSISSKLWSSYEQFENENDEKNQKNKKYILGPDYQDVSIMETASNFGSISPVKKPQETLTSEQQPKVDEEKVMTNEQIILSSDKSSSSSSSSSSSAKYDLGIGKNDPVEYKVDLPDETKKIVAKDAEAQYLSKALWIYGRESKTGSSNNNNDNNGVDSQPCYYYKNSTSEISGDFLQPKQALKYEDIDQSIPLSVFDPDNNVDLIWDLLRNDALIEAQREPLLVSFLYSSILNHPNLESALAFHLANRLASPSMISTQVMSLILEALDKSPTFRKYLRADLIAVRDRDPACTCLPDVFLHFKGFHALQSQRVAHYLWKEGRRTLAHFFQSQMSQHFQIDIHPNATLGSGIMLDHGTGVVIGETATVGFNCSILHHVTLGGSGKRGVDRHPKIGNGVLLGAGASVLGNIKIGDGCQVGAGTLVIGDLPPHSVAVGVPARIIGTYKDVDQPGQTMNQVGSEESDEIISFYHTDGI